MAIDHRKVRQALRVQMLEIPEPIRPPINYIAFENVGFVPPSNVMWMREAYMPGDDIRIASNMLECVGVYQLDLMIRLGKGTEELDGLALELLKKFKPGTDVSDEQTQIVTQRAARAPGMESSVQNQAYHQLPVRITFRAYAKNDE